MFTPQNYIEQYLTKSFFLNPFAVKPNKRFGRDLGLSFTEFSEVVGQLENLYNVSLPDESISPELSIRQLSKLVVQYSKSNV